MTRATILWDGKNLPRELQKIPPGRYTLETVDDVPELSDEQEKGIRDSLDELDAGNGLTLGEVIESIQKRSLRQ